VNRQSKSESHGVRGLSVIDVDYFGVRQQVAAFECGVCRRHHRKTTSCRHTPKNPEQDDLATLRSGYV